VGVRLYLGFALCFCFSNVGFAEEINGPDTIAAQAEVCEGALLDHAEPIVGNWVGTTLIFDSNIVYQPGALDIYRGATIIITGRGWDENDDYTHKRDKDPGIAYAIRRVTRLLDSANRTGADLSTGIKLENGSILKIDNRDHSALLSHTSYDPTKPDYKILATAVAQMLEVEGHGKVFLISDDGNMRVKANTVGVRSLPFQYEDAPPVAVDKTAPYASYEITAEEMASFQRDGVLPKPAALKMLINQFVMLSAPGVPGSVDTMARYFYEREPETEDRPANWQRFVGLRKMIDKSKLPLEPRNIPQHMASEVAMDPTVEAAVLVGAAGTGKTIIAVAAAKAQAKGLDAIYKRIVYLRTLVQMGKVDLGAFPGSLAEKLEHWYAALSDAKDALARIMKEKLLRKKDEARAAFEANRSEFEASKDKNGNVAIDEDNKPRNVPIGKRRGGHKSTKRNFPNGKYRNKNSDEIQNTKKERNDDVDIESVPANLMRGRNLEDMMVLVDEGQNGDVHEIKTYGTRAGQNSKLLFLGDPGQVDSPVLNAYNNGLSVLIERIESGILTDEEQSRIAVIRLPDGVRSPIAEIFRKLFESIGK
jgi:PhoH-like ATPase